MHSVGQRIREQEGGDCAMCVRCGRSATRNVQKKGKNIARIQAQPNEQKEENEKQTKKHQNYILVFNDNV